MPSVVDATDMVPSESSSSHGPPSLDRVRAPPRSPASSLLCSPPTPSPHRPGLRYPLPAAYPEVEACSWPPPACLHGRAGRRRVITGSPEHRLLLEEGGGPPRLLGCPLRPCRGSATPPGASSPLAPEVCFILFPLGNDAAAFRAEDPLGTRDPPFGAGIPTAHTLACLRIGHRVSTIAARLATDLLGSRFGRAGFAPAGQRTEFHAVIAYAHSPRTSLAWSHLQLRRGR